MPGVAIAMDVSESPAEEFPRIQVDLDAGESEFDQEVGGEAVVVSEGRRESVPLGGLFVGPEAGEPRPRPAASRGQASPYSL